MSINDQFMIERLRSIGNYAELRGNISFNCVTLPTEMVKHTIWWMYCRLLSLVSRPSSPSNCCCCFFLSSRFAFLSLTFFVACRMFLFFLSNPDIAENPCTHLNICSPRSFMYFAYTLTLFWYHICGVRNGHAFVKRAFAHTNTARSSREQNSRLKKAANIHWIWWNVFFFFFHFC